MAPPLPQQPNRLIDRGASTLGISVYDCATSCLGNKPRFRNGAKRDMQLACSLAQESLRGTCVGTGVDISRDDMSKTLEHPRPTIPHIRDKSLHQSNRVWRPVCRTPGHGADVVRHLRELDVSQRAQDLFVGIKTR